MPEEQDYPLPDYKRAWYQFTAEEWSGFTPQHWYWFIPLRLPLTVYRRMQELFVTWVESIRGRYGHTGNFK